MEAKRKLDCSASEKATKRPKLDVDEDDEHPHALTRLPPEILLDIFDYFKSEEIKKLCEVCKTFFNLCSLRLRVLKLDFYKIEATQQPVIRRAYTEIRMFGEEIDCSREEIGKILKSSAESARKLIVRNNGLRKSRAKVKMRFFMFVLQSLPNIEEIEITSVNGLMPQISRKAIKTSEESSLKSLKKLTLTNVPGTICLAFKNAKNIEELKLDITSFKDRKESTAYYDLVVFQKKLKLYHSSVRAPSLIPMFARLHAAFGGHNFEWLFDEFPDLEHIKVYRSREFNITQELLIAGKPEKSVKTIELLNTAGNFNIEKIRKKFPSLESFIVSNFIWSIERA